jgi:hypothetical protein
MSQPPDKGPSLEGQEADVSTPKALRKAIEFAFDYRGDVTLHTVDGREIAGYVFDRRLDDPDPYLRMIRADGSGRVNVRYAEITRLVFTGRDTAAGKSWETWLKNYQEKKARGETARLDPDPLDEEES